MNHPQINPALLHKLSTLIHDTQLSSLLHKYHQSASSQPPLQHYQHSSSAKNETTAKPKRLASNSKQRKLLLKKQSQHKFKPLPKAPLPQPPLKLQQPDLDSKKILKDKAVFINVTELPYLHSSDLLNHLYKNSSMSPQMANNTPFYNHPLNNTHALTKLKHLHIYYTQIQSLRDLGTGWSNLVQLSIYFGKLKDLSGLNAFPSLQYLHCPFNLIETLSDFMFHPTLVSIDLQFNQITEYSEVEHLFTVQNLEYVNLLNNPVYLNKEAKRKINQKCEKIIETENTRVEEYCMEKRREVWEIEQMEGVEYCNNVLNQFYLTCKKDDITLESKYLSYSRPDPEFDLITQEITPDSNQVQCQSSQCSVGQLKIEYIGPQIPEDAYFESMIMNGEDLPEIVQPYCQQKIFMTPLTSLINPKSVYVGPVLTKYLSNKLYIKDQKPKPKNQQQHNQSQQFTSTTTVKPNNQSLSNTLKDSQVNSVVNTLKGSQVNSVVNTLKDSSTNSVMIRESYITSNVTVGGIQTQTPSLFEKTSTSLSTNCTNLNNTSTSFGFKRTRPELSKSKQKSLGKLSLLAKLTENMGQTDLIRTSVGKTPQSQNSSLVKASRMFLGKPLIKEVTGVEDPFGRTEQGKVEKVRERSCEKGLYSTSLRRRNILSDCKKERSMVLKKEQEV